MKVLIERAMYEQYVTLLKENFVPWNVPNKLNATFLTVVTSKYITHVIILCGTSDINWDHKFMTQQYITNILSTEILKRQILF